MGYIGSHTVVELLRAGHQVYIVDNLENSSTEVLDNIKAITGQAPTFLEADIHNNAALNSLLVSEKVEGIIHFAAYKAVGESVAEPLKYYANNVSGVIAVLEAATANGVRSFLFSSSAAVYGTPPRGRATETTTCQPESPYGWSKRMSEIILADTCAANPRLAGAALRYFNVVGAHESGLLGESPRTPPQNVLPLIVGAAAGTLPPITVYGDDYPTPDGTCLRDYIHVVDLARAHVRTLEYLAQREHQSYEVFNIGTGRPTSVLELISTFERITDMRVPHTIGQRRPGDMAECYASAAKAKRMLHWQAEKTTEDAVRDAWRWHEALSTRFAQK
jgi:UDP-glucose 4-epimerase